MPMNAYEVAFRRARRAKSARAERAFFLASIVWHCAALVGAVVMCLAWYFAEPTF